MKAISVYDLKLIPELKHLNYFELIHPDNDKLVNPFLFEMGFDLDYPLMYTVSQHRTLQNKVVVGYVIRGEVRCDRKHLTGPWAETYDVLVAASHQDRSLCRELCSHMNIGLDYSAFHTSKEVDPNTPEQFPQSLTNEDEDEISKQIKQLEELLLHIRGSQYKADGSLKMPEDYHKPEEEEKKRKKHTRKTDEASTN